MTRRGQRRLLPYLSGAFGLSMSAQINLLVPLRAHELGASFYIIGLIVGSGALASALVAVPMGALIDRIGPRRSFVLGASATAGVSLLFLLVGNYWWLLALQPFLGIARNLGWLASQGYITSLGSTEDRPKLAGRFSFFSNGGQMAGPVLVGGVAQLVGFRLAFLFVTAYAIAFAILGVLLKETKTAGHESTRTKQGIGLRSAFRLFGVRGIQVVLMLTFARLWNNWVYTTFFPVYLVEHGIEPGVVGTVMATSGLVATMLAPTAGYWVRFLQAQTVTALGLACGAVGLLLAPHVAALPFVYLVPALVGIGIGLSLPLLMSMITAAVPAEMRGVALGLRAMVNQTAATAAPVIVGPLITALGMVLGFTSGGAVTAVMLLGSRLLHVIDRPSPERHQ